MELKKRAYLNERTLMKSNLIKPDPPLVQGYINFRRLLEQARG